MAFRRLQGGHAEDKIDVEILALEDVHANCTLLTTQMDRNLESSAAVAATNGDFAQEDAMNFATWNEMRSTARRVAQRSLHLRKNHADTQKC